MQDYEQRLQQKQEEADTLKEQLQAKNDEVIECDPDALLQARNQINELMEKNITLKQEVTQSQLEIGEVLFTAKKQANRTIEEAQVEAKHLIGTAELEVENIANSAKKILREVAESKEAVLEIYADLENKVDQLAHEANFTDRQQ